MDALISGVRAGDDIVLALANYQRRLCDFMLSKQDAAIGMASSFVPKTNFGLRVRAIASKFLGIGWFADLIIGRSLLDRIELPNY
jgi:hypothetical protein